MATRHASAVKAHRQTLKRTEHNRELRSKLRTGLKAIREAASAGDKDRAKTLARLDVFGGGQDGHQRHHSSQCGGPLQVTARQAPQVTGLLPATSRHRPVGELDDQSLDQDALVAA